MRHVVPAEAEFRQVELRILETAHTLESVHMMEPDHIVEPDHMMEPDHMPESDRKAENDHIVRLAHTTTEELLCIEMSTREEMSMQEESFLVCTKQQKVLHSHSHEEVGYEFVYNIQC
jgi:hypothetical protein